MGFEMSTKKLLVVFSGIFFILEAYACFSRLRQPDVGFQLLIIVTGISCIISTVCILLTLFKIICGVLAGIISLLYSTIGTVLCLLFFDISSVYDVKDESAFIIISIIVGLVSIFSLIMIPDKDLPDILNILPARNAAIVVTILFTVLYIIGFIAYKAL
ncbi:MAG: hypothetical protein LBF78_06745 [Treponema sp.]|jgi:hypothetical protein|nr:hypothetical protein [Treponema sp.]